MNNPKFEIRTHPRYGYKYLFPPPTTAQLNNFYIDQYYEFPTDARRAPDLQKFIQQGHVAEKEIYWLSKTLWLDIDSILRTYHGTGWEVLDVGCGTGAFARFMTAQGRQVVGVEPSPIASTFAKQQSIPIFNSLDDLKTSRPNGTFRIITLLNVLEHVSKPEHLLSDVRDLLQSGGTLIVRVPNDFSKLQEIARHTLGIEEPWWVVYPDHLNYFNDHSLAMLLSDFRFDIVEQQSDFPMELFLLFGDNYLDNPTLGAACHEKRKAFELSAPPEERRSLYRSFFKHGLGRNLLIAAKLGT